MPWYAPLTRREISLVLFSLTTFVLFYNLGSSFTSQPSDASWDDVIYGDWTWEEQRVAENARKHEKQTNDTAVPASFHPHTFGSVGVNDGILDWAGEIPRTTVLKHLSGYTIMDNVFMLNGTLFVVTDDPSFPSLDSIASSGENPQAGPRPSDWRVLSTAQAKETLGSFGGLIHGVSWLVTDASPGNYVLFSLWRTYSALDMSLSPDALTLPPPRRIFYPNVPTFVGEQPDSNESFIRRQRSPTGFHPMVAKAAFPTLGFMYAEDWADYALLHSPFLLERVVVADQGAARRAQTDLPPFAIPLKDLDTSKEWWEPIRRNVAKFLDVPEQAPQKSVSTKTKTVVTYLSRQDAKQGPKLRVADHKALVRALGVLGDGFEVHIVSARASWVERMRTIARSTVVIGVYGEHMADCMYIPPSERAVVMEMFPPKVFVQDTQILLGALDVRYLAWWEAREHGVNTLPPVAPSGGEGDDEVPIDVGALVQGIKRVV